MVSLIGNSNAFTSFSFGQPSTPAAPAPIPNTGQVFTGGGGTDPVFTDPAPESGLSAAELARIAMKDEANTFSKLQTIDNLKSGIYDVGATIDQHQDDIEDNKQKLVKIENTTDGLVVKSKVRASGFEIDDGTITNVKTTLNDLENLITENKSTADSRHADVTKDIGDNRRIADANHTSLSETVTFDRNTQSAKNNVVNAEIISVKVRLGNLENNKTAHDNRLNALEDTFEKVTLDENKLIFDNTIKLEAGRSFKYDKSGVETDLITQIETIEASIGSSKTDAELTAFINDNPNVRTDAELTTFLEANPNVRTDAELTTFLEANPNNRTDAELTTFIESNANVRTDAELNTFIESNTEIASHTNKLNRFLVDGSQLNINTDLQLLTGKVIKYNKGGGIISDFQTEIALNTTDLAINATNIANNTSNIATNINAISKNATDVATNTANITSNTNAIATINSAIPVMRADILSTFSQAENNRLEIAGINSSIFAKIDARIATVTTTVNDSTVGGLITRVLASQNIVKYNVTATFAGEFVNPSARVPVRGHFRGYNVPDSEPRRRLEFIFAVLDQLTPSNAHFKFVGVELFEDTLTFHKFIPDSARRIRISSTSGLSSPPSGWDELDYTFDSFVIHHYELAGNFAGHAVEDRGLESIANLHATNNGYGLAPVSSTTPTITASREDVLSRFNNIYTKTESDARYAIGTDFYNKTEADNKFATLTGVFENYYTQGISDSRYALITNVYNKTDSDARYDARHPSIADYTTRVGDLEAKVTTLETNQPILMAFRATQGAKNVSTAADITTNANDIDDLKNRVQVNEGDIDALETKADGFQTKFTTNDTNISNIKSDISDLETKTDDIATTASLITVSKNTHFTGGVDLGDGAVLHKFGTGGSLSVIDKITALEENSIFKSSVSDNVGKELKIDDIEIQISGSYEKVLTTSRIAELLENAIDPVSGQVDAGTIPTLSSSFFVPQSPFPFVYVTKQGQLASGTLDDAAFENNVFGNGDRGIDALGDADNNAKQFESGLVPRYFAEASGGKKGGTTRIGSSITLLTAEGTWRKLSDIFVENGVSTVSVSEHLPDFTPITHNNRFAMSSQVNGGTIVYNEIDTSFVSEHSSNLYHTPARVNSLIDTKVGDGSITNAVITHIESQTLTAASDIRKKCEIKRLSKSVDDLEPVQYEYRNDRGKTRYGFIAQDVQESHPDLVESDSQGYLSIKYMDIIAMVVKENQELKKRIANLENFVKIK